MKIKLPKVKKKKTVTGIIVAVVILSIGIVSTQGGKTMEVDVIIAEKGNVVSVLEETATVMAREERTINSMVTAEVKWIKEDIGKRVKKGDRIIELDIVDVDFQIKGLEAQKKSLQALLADFTNVDPEALQQSLSQIRSAEATLDNANRDLENNSKLYEAGVISEESYKRTINDQIIKKEALEVLKQNHVLIKKGISSDLKQKYFADIEAITLQIEQLENAKSKHSIISPIDGIITEKFINVGDLLLPGTPVVEIANESTLYLTTDVLASEMKLINEKTKVLVDDEDLNLMLDGYVSKVYPKAFSKISDLGIEQKRVKLELELQKIDQLKLGYEVDVDIIEEIKEDVLRLPDSSVFKINQEWHVFVVDNGKAVLKPVEVGLKGRDNFEIIKGIEVGEIIIDSPENELTEGVGVTIKE